MGRRPVLGALVAAAALLAACGEEPESYSSARVERALKLERVDRSYAVESDPFCIVKVILNDSDEVDAAPPEFVLASPGRHVGIEVQPPFAKDCAREAKRALTKLDPREE